MKRKKRVQLKKKKVKTSQKKMRSPEFPAAVNSTYHSIFSCNHSDKKLCYFEEDLNQRHEVSLDARDFFNI